MKTTTLKEYAERKLTGGSTACSTQLETTGRMSIDAVNTRDWTIRSKHRTFHCTPDETVFLADGEEEKETYRNPLTYQDVEALTWKWYVRGGEAQLEKDIDSLTGYADTAAALDTFSKLEVLARGMKEKLLNKPIQ